jgi:hypothetical protein
VRDRFATSISMPVPTTCYGCREPFPDHQMVMLIVRDEEDADPGEAPRLVTDVAFFCRPCFARSKLPITNTSEDSTREGCLFHQHQQPRRQEVVH